MARSLDDVYTPLAVSDDDDLGRNRSSNQPLLELHRARMSRRTALKGFAVAAAAGALGGTMASRFAMAAAGDPSTLGFTPLEQVIMDDHQVAPGYTPKVLMRWGDKVLADAPDWDPNQLSAEAQARQFGYNNDYVAYFPLPRGSDSAEHGLLHANHEYTSPELMFPNWSKEAQTAEQSAI